MTPTATSSSIDSNCAAPGATRKRSIVGTLCLITEGPGGGLASRDELAEPEDGQEDARPKLMSPFGVTPEPDPLS